MIASPLPRPPRNEPERPRSAARGRRSRATAPSARGRAPAPAARSSAPGSRRPAPRTARRTGHRRAPGRSASVPSGSRSSMTWVVDHAEQRQATRHVEADEAVGRPSSPAQKPTLRAPEAASRTALPLACGRVAQLGLEGDHPLLQRRVGGGQDAYGEQAGVAGVADGDGGDRHAGRHLHDREQRVHAVEVLQRHRDADHRQRRDRRRACRAGGRLRRRRR